MHEMKSMGVTIRKRKLPSGSVRLFLDIRHGGNRWYEGLGIILSDDRTLNKNLLLKAKEVRNNRELELLSERHHLPKPNSGSEDFISFFADLTKQKNSTWVTVLLHLKIYCPSGVRFCDLSPRWLEGFKSYLEVRLRPNTAALYFEKIKASLRIAMKQDLLVRNPIDKVEPIKKEKSLRTFLDLHEIEILYNTPSDNPDLRRAFLFACATGLRLSDVKSLRGDNISPDGRIRFRIKKTSTPESLPLSQQALELIGDITYSDKPIFNLPESDGSLWTHIQKWVGKTEIKKHVSFHTSRHTFAVLALDSGIDVFTLKELLGHKDIRHTLVYAKIVDKKKREAINMMPYFHKNQ